MTDMEKITESKKGKVPLKKKFVRMIKKKSKKSSGTGHGQPGHVCDSDYE